MRRPLFQHYHSDTRDLSFGYDQRRHQSRQLRHFSGKVLSAFSGLMGIKVMFPDGGCAI
jgi:hypothetical protein